MRAGRLRHLVTIQQTTETRGADGSVIDTWGTYCTGWADIRPKSSTEDYLAQGLSGSVVHEIRMRYKSGVVPKMRVLYGSRVFQIVGVINWEEKGAEMLLNCYEVV